MEMHKPLTLFFVAAATLSLSAHSQVKRLDEASLDTVTGQAGITIELENQISIERLSYRDEGELILSGITLGGGDVVRDSQGAVLGVSGLFNDAKIDIDTQADGDATIHLGSITGDPIDYALGIQSVMLSGGGESTVLISNFGIQGLLNSVDIAVDTESDRLSAVLEFSVEDLDMDLDLLGMGIRDLTIRGADFDKVPTQSNYFAKVSTNISSIDNARSLGGKAMFIQVDTFSVDVNVGSVLVGGALAGSVALNDLTVSDTKLQVYGH